MATERTSMPATVATPSHHSSELLRLLVESLGSYAIMTLDQAGTITTWSLGAERLYGHAARHIVGQSVSRLLRPEDEGALQQSLKGALGEGWRDEQAVHVRSDGTPFWASVSLSALRGLDGRPLGFGMVCRDITEARRAYEAALESEEQHRHLLALMPDAVVVNCDDRIAYCNEAFARLIGAGDRSQLIGRPLLALFHPRHHATIRGRIERMRQQGGESPRSRKRLCASTAASCRWTCRPPP